MPNQLRSFTEKFNFIEKINAFGPTSLHLGMAHPSRRDLV